MQAVTLPTWHGLLVGAHAAPTWHALQTPPLQNCNPASPQATPLVTLPVTVQTAVPELQS